VVVRGPAEQGGRQEGREMGLVVELLEIQILIPL